MNNFIGKRAFKNVFLTTYYLFLRLKASPTQPYAQIYAFRSQLVSHFKLMKV